ncbi:MAG: M15 family metallopeptidase [Pyrinomonadaceae bacterium]
MNVKSYLGKIFVIAIDPSVIRDENLAVLKYQTGDQIPAGANVGDAKKIPKGTEINVTDVRAPDRKNVFVFARPANDSGGSFGWTRADNLAGGFMGEVCGFAPAEYEKEPEGNNKTCFDAMAVIRGGPPAFTATTNKIPERSFVMVTETSADRKHVKVSKLEIVDGEMVVGDEIGWTKANNLADGCSTTDQFFSAGWKDRKGPNACWERGTYLGPRVMVNITGVDTDMEQVTFATLAPYLKLVKAAADEANLTILINSAFRTFQRQAELFEEAQSGGNTAAPPGGSHHQHGQAFDLNTGKHALQGTDELYEWLKRNGPKHGFIRTVNREPWHWEYRPQKAAELAALGQFKFPADII